MATMDPKDPGKNDSFFRKVVRFVAHPTTEWADLNTIQRESVDADMAKSELKAMIERKRRNDFVRKREFDMLRKIRREGLTGERLASLEGLSRLDDSQLRSQDSGSRADNGVKAKIDAIEQQMVGESTASALPAAPAARPAAPPPRRAAAVMRSTAPAPLHESFFNATTSPQVMRGISPAEVFRPTGPLEMDADALSLAPTEVAPLYGDAPHSAQTNAQHSAQSGQSTRADPLTAGASTVSGHRVSALSPLYNVGEQSQAGAVEVTELAHDPDLDEAVIAFANADFDQCERLLTSLVSNSGSRRQHSETWLALFDLYRAVGQQAKFDALALEYVHRFGWSPPQWYSLPKLVADAAALGEQQRPATAPARSSDTTIGWVGPAVIDVDTVANLRSQLLQMPLPWVLDWRGVRHIEAQACNALTKLLHDWAGERIEMRWVGGEGFFALLSELAPTGVKDADPAIWMLRLEALRLANRVVDFDQIAIDYCLTYEVSPPSWEPAKCSLRMSSGSGLTVAPITNIADVVSTGFLESQPLEDDTPPVATLELSGQLVGDIGPMLRGMDAQIGAATLVQVSCARLIRLDFLAAGDLLNWVLSKRGENRSIQFVDAHRLVALFCGAMGINEHARVTVRQH